MSFPDDLFNFSRRRVKVPRQGAVAPYPLWRTPEINLS